MKHEIEIEELPEGWKPVAYGKPCDDDYVFLEGKITKGKFINKNYEHLIVEKIQPRRIVLEETDETRIVVSGEWCNIEGRLQTWDGQSPSCNKYRVWREVKETDLSLPKDEPKLSLSVDECKSISRFLSVSSEGTTKKILEFIKGK